MTIKKTSQKTTFANIEVSTAGWFLVAAAAWELVFNRIFTALGVYTRAGADSRLALLAESGQFAMNAVGIMGLLLACILLPRLAADSRLAPLPARLFLMLTSPLFLPVTCVAIFRPVSVQLIVVSYLITMSAVLYLSILVACNRFDGGSRRLLLFLAFIETAVAFELMTGDFFESFSQKAHFAAEAMFLATPVFAFLLFVQGRFFAMLKRPPVTALLFAISVTGFAFAVSRLAAGKTLLTLILLAYKSLGLTMAMPGGPTLYLIALFFGALLVGCLIFPSAAIRPTANSRKLGFGLACIFTAGLQPTHPYLSILVLTGFLYLAQHMMENIVPDAPPATRSHPLETAKNNI
jgi:hypothetical protein